MTRDLLDISEGLLERPAVHRGPLPRGHGNRRPRWSNSATVWPSSSRSPTSRPSTTAASWRLVDAGSVIHADRGARGHPELDGLLPCGTPSTRTDTSTTASGSRPSRPRTGAAPAEVIAHEAVGPPLRPLPDDQRLQRHHQHAAVPPRRTAVPLGLPLPGPHLPRVDLPRPWVTSRCELHHAKGETDDHTWAWLPAQRRPVHRGPVHLGGSRTAATPRRSSATRWSGPRCSARMQALGRRASCCPATACRSPGAENVCHGPRGHRRTPRVGHHPVRSR